MCFNCNWPAFLTNSILDKHLVEFYLINFYSNFSLLLFEQNNKNRDKKLFSFYALTKSPNQQCYYIIMFMMTN